MADKSLGQHWLNDPASLQAMLEAAEIEGDDTVLEIGPGHGTLTRKLAKTARQVIAIEKDGSLAKKLADQQIAKNLQIISGDIMQFDLTKLIPGYKVVANIPYYLTSHLIRLLCESPNPPKQMALLVQKEVAERMAAAPGAMSLLSVSVQYYYNVELDRVVPAKLFAPPPKVDSQIVKLSPKSGNLSEYTDTRQYFRIVKAGFSARRKKLRSSLSAGLRITKNEAAKLLESAGVSPDSRAQELSLNDWRALHESYIKNQ